MLDAPETANEPLNIKSLPLNLPNINLQQKDGQAHQEVDAEKSLSLEFQKEAKLPEGKIFQSQWNDVKSNILVIIYKN